MKFDDIVELVQRRERMRQAPNGAGIITTPIPLVADRTRKWARLPVLIDDVRKRHH